MLETKKDAKTIKIATWNVNSVKARLPNVQKWLKETQPDVVLLQETKCVAEAFPYIEIEELGYNCEVLGQKSYNGVAILSKFPIEDVQRGIPNFEDVQARYIEGVINVGSEAIRVASIYLPNGSEVGSDKFQHKMNFYEALQNHAENLLKYDEKLVLGGDYNVGIEDIDVYNPDALRGSICFHPDEQRHFRKLLNLGLRDSWRDYNPDMQKFSWWDYRGGGWQNNRGMRIDYLLLNADAADAVKTCDIHDSTRGAEKASDHAPVVVGLEV